VTASIRAFATTPTNSGGSSITMSLPTGIQAGDLLFVVLTTGAPSLTITDDAAKGWWAPTPRALYGTRSWWTFARIYNPSDPASTYTFTQSGMGAVRGIAYAIQGHAVTQASGITAGTFWTRTNNGGSQALTRAPSITTPQADMLVLAFTGEATNTAGGYTVTAANGFTPIVELTEDANFIEWMTSAQKVQAAAGATGNYDITYAHVGGNGAGVQYAIPTAAQQAITTGRIGAHVATGVEHDRFTVGADRLGGTTVQAALLANGNEITRQTITHDATTGWGNTAFTGLASDTLYTVEFYVDGVKQTDAALTIRTFPAPGTPKSYVLATGSCQFTGSNHPIWDVIKADNPVMLAHMGDLHYNDATTEPLWRAGVEASLTAPRMKSLLEQVAFNWAWDNHDRIITNVGGAGSALNLGTTDPQTATAWKQMAGTTGWASADAVGRTWVVGRVRYIQTDNWTMKQDPDAGVTGPTFLGAAQKQWFKDTLAAATEPAIIWLCQWTGQEHANGRWNSFPAETTELENWINARPEIKSRMILIGGDSHSLQVTDGSRTAAQGQRFSGMPNWNISGFNRTSTAPNGSPGWLVDDVLRTSAQAEADWGGYSRLTVDDDGQTLSILWEGVRVGPTGATDVMASQTYTVTTTSPELFFFDSVTRETLTPIYWDGTTEEALTAEWHAEA